MLCLKEQSKPCFLDGAFDVKVPPKIRLQFLQRKIKPSKVRCFLCVHLLVL